MKNRAVIPIFFLFVLSWTPEAWALGIPLEQVEGRWTPTELDQVQITAFRLTIIPSLDDREDTVLWTVDESLLIRNFSDQPVTFELGIPNAFSANDPAVTVNTGEFWGRAYVNGRPVSTEVVALVLNPAHPSIAFRTARRFEIRLEGNGSAHLRLMFALPVGSTQYGERSMRYPFEIGRLYDGPIEFGVLVLRWTDQMFAFRSNLGSYSLYRDRVEWFIRAFAPTNSLDVQFLPRQAVFRMVAEHFDCPMPWEVMDRMSGGDMQAVFDMLQPYTTERLVACSALPPVLQGSLASALEGNLRDLRLESIAPERSGIEGPLFVLNPEYDSRLLGEVEAVYSRVLRQEVARRQD